MGPQDRCEKMVRSTAHSANDVLNDEFVAGHAVYYQFIYRGHIIFSACAFGLPMPCFQSVQFLKTNISEYNVETPVRCGGICNDRFTSNFLLSILVKKTLRIGQYLAKILISLATCFLTHGVGYIQNRICSKNKHTQSAKKLTSFKIIHTCNRTEKMQLVS